MDFGARGIGERIDFGVRGIGGEIILFLPHHGELGKWEDWVMAAEAMYRTVQADC